MARRGLTKAVSGVYRITGSDGGFYIGSSQNILARWNGHKTYLRKGDHRSKQLQAAFNASGLESLKFEILFLCDLKDLLFYEQRALDVFRPPYNASPTAGSCKGIARTAETKAKCAAAKIGKVRGPMSPETREKIAAAARARSAQPEYRAMLSASMKGKPKSAEHRAKLAEINKGKVLTPEHREKIGASNRATNSAKRKNSGSDGA
ncbi:GIY-YIG nuclease family protein [Paraburkholderia sp. BL17N1]|uniref:GIY-YIG nuclease family protein n=1 Tax=Paraburkholderia sp. BL17N1 TaxID=1938798 RepID=UPI000EAE2A16|nr:GIY-YIG nuclease family protein [Paraburkholderia sp. BL17N1]RKR46275.1 group I intron endonuclease [Paraburkholderia sp. BL17N1]